jgi:predicted metal-dependent peptidase
LVRPLTVDEQRQLVAARLVAVEHAPYLAHALFSVAANAAVGLGTFAVDRGWRLYLDPIKLAKWGPALSGGVLIHEMSHLVRAHAERADALGASYDHNRWNIASDLSINDDLLAGRISLPLGAVTPGQFGLDECGIEEAYYAQLADRRLPLIDRALRGQTDDACRRRARRSMRSLYTICTHFR